MRCLFLFLMLSCALSVIARDPVEGEWRVNGGGPVLLLRQAHDDADRIEIVWVDGPDVSVRRGSVVGYAVPAPEAGVYDCVGLDPRSSKGRKGAKAQNSEFVIRMDREYGHTLIFEPYKRSKSVDVYRFFPWWLRVRVKTTDTRPKGLDGARRTDAPPPFIVL